MQTDGLGKLNTAAEFKPLANFPLQPIPKIKKFKPYRLPLSLAKTEPQTLESHGPKLLQLDASGQIIHREPPPPMPEKVGIALAKATKIKRIKYRANDHVEEYWKYWKGGSNNVNDYGRMLRDDGRQTSLRLQEIRRS